MARRRSCTACRFASARANSSPCSDATAPAKARRCTRISGLIGKLAGSVRFDGRDITRASPRDIVRAGLVQVLEGHRVFPPLTVEDNLLIGTYAHHPRGDRSWLDRASTNCSRRWRNAARQPASRLSGGQQQILAVAQGMIAQPRLLILDEPSGGLAPMVVDRILDVARALTATGWRCCWSSNWLRRRWPTPIAAT